MIIFLAWEARSHEPKRKAFGSGFMRTRLPGQEEICDVMVIEMVHSVTSPALTNREKKLERTLRKSRLKQACQRNLTACQQDVFALLVRSC
jgi:hypothetical protein